MSFGSLFASRGAAEPRAFQHLWNTSIARVGGPSTLPDDFDWERELQDIARRTGLYDLLAFGSARVPSPRKAHTERKGAARAPGHAGGQGDTHRHGDGHTHRHGGKHGHGVKSRHVAHGRPGNGASRARRGGSSGSSSGADVWSSDDSTYCTASSTRSSSPGSAGGWCYDRSAAGRAKGVQANPRCCSVGSQVVANTVQARVQAGSETTAAYCQTEFNTQTKGAQHRYPQMSEFGVQCEVVGSGKFSPRPTSSVASSPNTFLSPTEYRSTYSRSAHTTYSRAASPPPLSPKLSPADSKAVGFAASTKLGAQSLIRFSRYAVTPPESSSSSSSSSSSPMDKRTSATRLRQERKGPTGLALQEAPTAIKRKAAVSTTVKAPTDVAQSQKSNVKKEGHIPPVHANVIEHLRRRAPADASVAASAMSAAPSPRTLSPQASADGVNTDDELDSQLGPASVDSMAHVRKWHAGGTSSGASAAEGQAAAHSSASTPTHAYGAAVNNNSVNTANIPPVTEPLLPPSSRMPATVEKDNDNIDIMAIPGMKEFLPVTAPRGRTLTYPKRSFEGTDVWYRQGVWSTVPARVPEGYPESPLSPQDSPMGAPRPGLARRKPASPTPMSSPVPLPSQSPPLRPATREAPTEDSDSSESPQFAPNDGPRARALSTRAPQ